MKVLQVVPSLAIRTGGPAVTVAEASRALAENGVGVSIMATDMAKPASARDRSTRLSEAEVPNVSGELNVHLYRAKWPYRLAFSPDLRRALRRTVRDYDVVHIHSLFLFPQYAAFHAARNAEIPYVVSPRGALDPWLREQRRFRKAVADIAWQRRMLGGASIIHVTSQQEAEFIADVAGSVPRAVVPNGIQWEAFQSLPSGDAFRQRFLAGFDGPLVLVHGRIARKKRLDLLVRAVALLSRELPDCRLALVGPDDEELGSELMSVARDGGIDDRVSFCGFLTGEDRLSALAAADVWALPSHTENFAVAVVEALAAGLPVVISPAVGVAQEAERAGAAVVCEADAEGFASRLASLLSDPSAAAQLGDRARKFARGYDWRRVAPQLRRLYEQAAAHR